MEPKHLNGALTGATQTVPLEFPGMGACAIQLSGTWVGTIVFEVSLTKDTWTTLNVTPPNSTSAVTSSTANGLWSGGVAGMHAIRARCSAYTSGTILVDLLAVQASAAGSGGGGGGGGGDASAANQVLEIADLDAINANAGATTDVTVQGNNTGTLNARLRGISVVLNDVWDSVSHFLKVSIQNTTLAVTQSGSWVISAGTAIIGAIALAPRTAGGTSAYHKVSAGSNNADTVKASAGQVYGIHVFNLAAYPVYVKVFNKATNPTPGVDTVLRTIGVQAGLRGDDMIAAGMPFATGIAIAIVKGIADSDNTAVLASDCVVDVDYA